MLKAKLPNIVRTFIVRRNGSKILKATGGRLGKGIEVEMGQVCTMTYDRTDHLVLPISVGNYMCFILLHELGPLNSVRA